MRAEPRQDLDSAPGSETPTPLVQTEGWYGPPNSRRFHYFRSGRSLCGKWLVFAPDSEIPWDCALGPANGDCADCKRKHGAEQPQAAERPPKTLVVGDES